MSQSLFEFDAPLTDVPASQLAPAKEPDCCDAWPLCEHYDDLYRRWASTEIGVRLTDQEYARFRAGFQTRRELEE